MLLELELVQFVQLRKQEQGWEQEVVLVFQKRCNKASVVKLGNKLV